MGKHIKSNKNGKFKFLGTLWDEESEFPDRSYFVSHMPDCFECIVKKHETFADNLPFFLILLFLW